MISDLISIFVLVLLIVGTVYTIYALLCEILDL